MGEVLVTGSLAYDSIQSPEGTVDKSLGGSANFFSMAAHHYSPVRVVGVVGEDYSEDDFNVLRNKKNIDTSGIQTVPGGKTFHWQGKYEGDLSEAITLQTDLNVLADFNAELPESYHDSSHVFLANMVPALQLRVLEQVKSPKLVATDTMNLWIEHELETLKKVLEKTDILFINEGEANMLTNTSNAIAASKELLKMGPSSVLVKRGEYGVVIRDANEIAILPAYPVSKVCDPTGAGDSFAGGTFGYLCQQGKSDFNTLKEACVYGTVMASFTVEKFGLGRLMEVTAADLSSRREELLKISRF